jgi:hypothetical protein
MRLFSTPCDVYSCIGEHITLAACDLTQGSAVAGVWLNFGNFHPDRLAPLARLISAVAMAPR